MIRVGSMADTDGKFAIEVHGNVETPRRVNTFSDGSAYASGASWSFALVAELHSGEFVRLGHVGGYIQLDQNSIQWVWGGPVKFLLG